LLGTGAVVIAVLAVRLAWTESEARQPSSDLELPEHSAAAEVAP